MQLIWGIVLIVLSLVCWGGQLISWLSPRTAERLTLTEVESDVDPAFYGDIRGEAAWDTLTLWTLLAAGVLLTVDRSEWAYFGLIGGAMYVYFAGRGIFTRLAIRNRGLRIGSPSNVTTAFVALSVWGLAGIVTVVMAATALPAT